ncbi:hypothetical protein OPV22_024484 [Ensete ventricosum]|uniref:Integrase catalytic domain-containing protein n=1 Tax=Ensete ventricosum TaxID=4639 RepID=A0AAV8P8P2_ENSVE|nr:hypothetical protein OPV22_024484 [Ensete ventricosum]
MANAYVKRVMIDTGSSADVLYFDAFQRLRLTDLDLTPLTSTLTGFTGDSISPMGTTTIPVTFGGELRSKTLLVSFMVVKLPSAYNAIIGRPTLNRLRAVVSTYHRVLKFPTRAGVGEVRSDPRESKQCYLTTTTLCKRPRTEPFGVMPPGPEESTRDTRSAERVLELSLDPSRPDRLVKVGSELPENQQVQLIDFLRKNDDVFAWTPNDMPGVDPEIAQHYLNISPDARPVKQRPRKFALDRQKAIEDEVIRILDAQLIEEVKYPTWLSNVVLVKKTNENWRMCVDYTDLNRACPKDCYLLPRIDQLVDATSGHQLLSFMDAFSGYNQIQMAPRDKRNTAFITHNGTYCYKVMPFRLKNAGATYQRLVNRMFKDQVRRNMEIYVDDMIVKSRQAETHLSNLAETFRTLRKYKMRLNPTKCTFGITSGKFLSFIVHQRGIDANPDKIKAIQEMQPPKTIKEVQRLAGRLAALRTIGPSISSTMMTVDQEDGGWTDEILRFKQAGILPEDKAAARRIRRAEEPWYYIVDGCLYRRGFSRSLLRCLNPTEAQTTLAEIHEGICGDHVGARTLAHMVLRQGYYCPTLRKDAQAYVRNCEPCQKHARFQHQPMVPLTTADCAWPFAQWGMDLLGPFPPASGQRRFLIVGVDYFTKWLEAEPLASITERQVEGFVWKNIITRFGLPRAIITDNGT